MLFTAAVYQLSLLSKRSSAQVVRIRVLSDGASHDASAVRLSIDSHDSNAVKEINSWSQILGSAAKPTERNDSS